MWKQYSYQFKTYDDGTAPVPSLPAVEIKREDLLCSHVHYLIELSFESFNVKCLKTL